MGVTSAWSPLGNFLEGQAHPNGFAFLQFSSNQGFSIFCVVKFLSHVFLSLLSGGSYLYLYIFYIFFYCTVGSLLCAG